MQVSLLQCFSFTDNWDPAKIPRKSPRKISISCYSFVPAVIAPALLIPPLHSAHHPSFSARTSRWPWLDLSSNEAQSCGPRWTLIPHLIRTATCVCVLVCVVRVFVPLIGTGFVRELPRGPLTPVNGLSLSALGSPLLMRSGWGGGLFGDQQGSQTSNRPTLPHAPSFGLLLLLLCGKGNSVESLLQQTACKYKHTHTHLDKQDDAWRGEA